MSQKTHPTLNGSQTALKSQKRKADEAFSKTKQSSIRDRPHTSKVVNFQDDSDGISKPNSSHKPHKLENAAFGDSKSSVGRLKKRAQDLLVTRQSLPIYPHADEIRSKLADNDVVLLVGETGSGKSTQIPQFLLHSNFTRRASGKNGSSGVGGCIAITQPRRVAAISLARRVAEEVGTPLGNSSPASQVGYSVRFDTSTGPNTRIKFLTDGMLLQELLRDPWLKEYSVVVVDEVHERGVNVDLVLGFLKRIIERRHQGDGRGGVPLKVVVMSATADMERIETFFTSKPPEDGETNGESKDAEPDREEFQGFDEEERPSITASNDLKNLQHKTTRTVHLTSCFIKGRQFAVKVNYVSQAVSSSWDAALERIIQIHQHTPLPGDVLVFLPGQEAIDSLESMCISYANTFFQQSKQKGAPKVPKLLILPLFAALPTAAQQRVFEVTPPFTRKIILSTNIAETSVTVPGIRHVIDTGKRKARFFRPSLNLDTLLTKPISRSSAKQRAGRAGREAPGSCWRLYTEKTYYELEADTEPEILRCDLSQLVLTLKAHDVDDILTFPLLTQPPAKALERALLHLLQLKALDPKTGHITSLGRQMSSLPLPANLARILLASLEPQYNCLDEIIDIVSGLSVENIWLPVHNRTHPPTQQGDDSSEPHPNNSVLPTTTPHSKPESNNQDEDDDQPDPITAARRTLFRRSGDHLTLLAAIQAYTAEFSDRKAWCRRHGISHRAMTAAMDVRKQLTKLMSPTGIFRRRGPSKQQTHRPEGSRDKAPSSSSSPSSPSITTATSRTQTEPEPKLEPLDTRILLALLTGLHTNTAHLHPHTASSSSSRSTSSAAAAAATAATSTDQGPYRTYYTSKPLTIHPSSVLFSREKGSRAADVMFSEFVFTSRAYARCVSEVRGEWIERVMRDVEA